MTALKDFALALSLSVLAVAIGIFAAAIVSPGIF